MAHSSVCTYDVVCDQIVKQGNPRSGVIVPNENLYGWFILVIYDNFMPQISVSWDIGLFMNSHLNLTSQGRQMSKVIVPNESP